MMRILSCSMSEANLWQQINPPWNFAKIMSLRSSLTTHSGCGKIRRHQKMNEAARKLQSGSQKFRGCLTILALPSQGMMSMGSPSLSWGRKTLRMLAWPRQSHWLSCWSKFQTYAERRYLRLYLSTIAHTSFGRSSTHSGYEKCATVKITCLILGGLTKNM